MQRELRIAIQAGPLREALRELSSLLERLPQLVGDELRGRVDALLTDRSKFAFTYTPGTSHDVLGLEVAILGIDEILAAAREAAQLQGGV